MEIKLMSDCHLEFGGMEPGEGDVLILAGDVVIVNDIALETPQGKYYKRWLKRASKSYKKVFMVLGNHEHYHGDILEVVKQLKESVPENVTILQNESELYEGVQFVGTTLWTNYNNEDPNVMEQASLQMNDFACVRKGEFGSFSVSDALSEHKKAVKYLDETLPKLKEPTVVITHHAPHPNSLGEYVLGELKYAYHSDLTELIEKHKPLYWCHGHIHNNKDYKIGDTTILCNPRGYKNYAENDDFDPTFTVTVKEVAQAAPTAT
jgi:Icc-related predicted phosphoesterase